MRKSYITLMKYYSGKHPTFFWVLFAGVMAVLATIWFGFIGPFCVSSTSSILVVGWLGLTIAAVFLIAAITLSIVIDKK